MSSTFLDMDLAWTLDEADDKVERVEPDDVWNMCNDTGTGVSKMDPI